MQRQDFSFELPENLIAQKPSAKRVDSRLLVMDGVGQDFQHLHFHDLPSLLRSDDLLIFNDTRVIPARLFGQKSTGGKVEIMLERVLDKGHALAYIRSSKSPKVGAALTVADAFDVEVVERQDELFKIKFLSQKPVVELLESYGHIPLPPYIKRADEKEDVERYQTVYGCKKGAVAAPTAGLHFDHDLLNKIKKMGVQSAYVTLHVGAGTFQPMRVEKIQDHVMHSEYIEVSREVCQQIQATKQVGGRVIAVGTTAVRCLESAAREGILRSFCGETDIFIYPGYEFKVVDALITNFHLPESTLLMLICAFAGFDETLAAYRCAVEKQYRFFSYGDAMFVSKKVTNFEI